MKKMEDLWIIPRNLGSSRQRTGSKSGLCDMTKSVARLRHNGVQSFYCVTINAKESPQTYRDTQFKETIH